jgi:hypothetical protein
VRALLGGVDGTALHTLLRLRRPLLTAAWLEAIGVCGRRTSAPKLDLTEAAIAGPVTEFVSGCGCRLKPGQYQVRAAACGSAWQRACVCMCVCWGAGALGAACACREDRGCSACVACGVWRQHPATC